MSWHHGGYFTTAKRWNKYRAEMERLIFVIAKTRKFGEKPFSHKKP
jgi:hypothetical protein